MGKLLPMEGIFDMLEQHVFHQPEKEKTGKNVQYLHRLPTEMSEKQIKNVFPLARKPLSTDRNAFKNTFPLDGKINLAVAELSQNGRKKMVYTNQKISFHQQE